MMVWLAVDKSGAEWIFNSEPHRTEDDIWVGKYDCVDLPAGFIEKFLGYKITWKDEPVEIRMHL